MFEAQIPDLRRRGRSRRKRAARQGVAHRARAARAHRLRRAACRPPPERISAARPRSGSPGSPASPARPARAIVLMERAALFVDGRYTLQAREQVDTSLFEIVHLVETPPDQWIERNLAKGDTLGYDPWLHTVEGAEKLAAACANAGATLVADRAQSDRRDLDRPPCPAARPGDAARHPLCRRSRRDQARDASVPRSPSSRPTRWSCPIRTPSPGRSTSAAPTSRTRRCRSPSRSIPREGRPSLFIDGRKLSQRRARPAGGARRRARARRLRRARSPRSARPARPCVSIRHRRRRAGAHRDRAPAARRRKGADPITAAQGGEERGRDRRRARGAPARRRSDGALPRLVRPRGADAAS